jgi:exosortase/archaeosortase family protein
MANRKKQGTSAKSSQKEQNVSGRFASLKAAWKDKIPVWKYLLGFAILLTGFYSIYVSSFFEERFLKPFLRFQTEIASAVLNLFAQATTADSAILQSAEATLNVAKGCDGMEASALFLIGVLLMPFSWRSKMVGILAGAVVLFLLNLLRIIILFLSKKYFPSAFETLHIHGGFALFTIVAILLWATWSSWAIRQEKKNPHVPA